MQMTMQQNHSHHILPPLNWKSHKVMSISLEVNDFVLDNDMLSRNCRMLQLVWNLLQGFRIFCRLSLMRKRHGVVVIV